MFENKYNESLIVPISPIKLFYKFKFILIIFISLFKKIINSNVYLSFIYYLIASKVKYIYNELQIYLENYI